MPKVELYSIKSKKTGNNIECLRVTFGVYQSLVFPSPAELEYIKNLIRGNAHKDFQEEE